MQEGKVGGWQSRLAQAIKQDHISKVVRAKRDGDMAQVVKLLPSNVQP
jgi:hypothetical protein